MITEKYVIVFNMIIKKSDDQFIMFQFRPMIGIPAETNGPKNQKNKVTFRKSNAQKSSKSL